MSDLPSGAIEVHADGQEKQVDAAGALLVQLLPRRQVVDDLALALPVEQAAIADLVPPNQTIGVVRFRNAVGYPPVVVKETKPRALVIRTDLPFPEDARRLGALRIDQRLALETNRRRDRLGVKRSRLLGKRRIGALVIEREQPPAALTSGMRPDERRRPPRVRLRRPAARPAVQRRREGLGSLPVPRIVRQRQRNRQRALSRFRVVLADVEEIGLTRVAQIVERRQPARTIRLPVEEQRQ